MSENKDTNAERVTASGAGNTSQPGSGSPKVVPTPIFESFIYDFVKMGLGGDGTGKPGTIGGPIGGQDPKFRVLTYPFMPPQVEDIEGS
jgi:hypothetical protein